MLRHLHREPGFYKRLFRLALPLILQNLITTSLGFVDTFMVGMLGQNELSAVTAANTPIYMIQIIILGLLSGLSVLASQYWGKGDTKSINRCMGVSLYAGLEGALERMYPYDVDVVQSLDEVPPEQETTLNEDTLERVQAAAADAGRKVELLQWSTPGDTVGYYTGNTFTLVAQEGVSTEIRLLTADDYGRLTGHTVDLEPEEVLVQAENLDLPDTFYIEDLPFTSLGPSWTFPRYNSSILISGQTAQLFLVVADETVVSAISDRDASRVHREFRVQVDLDGTEEEKLAFVDPLLAADANDVYSVISHQDNAVDLYTMYGGFLFLGVFLGLLFLLSTVLIIYYKQISEGYEDQRRYQIMQQVGMSPREVRSSIRSQVLLVFFLPLVTAGIHVAAAFPMLCKLLELFNLL